MERRRAYLSVLAFGLDGVLDVVMVVVLFVYRVDIWYFGLVVPAKPLDDLEMIYRR